MRLFAPRFECDLAFGKVTCLFMIAIGYIDTRQLLEGIQCTDMKLLLFDASPLLKGRTIIHTKAAQKVTLIKRVDLLQTSKTLGASRQTHMRMGGTGRKQAGELPHIDRAISR